MEIFTTKKFEKMLNKCPQEIKEKLVEKIKLFRTDVFNPTLNNHALSGKLKNLRSINITGDWRVVYEEESEKITLTAIGTHNQLYK
jgi:addiction module RelE/StbE family toxin